jgi:hypothetical protein
MSSFILLMNWRPKKAELQKTITELKQHVSELQENIVDNSDLNQENIIPTKDEIPPPNIAINYNKNENEKHHYPSQVEPTYRTLILDTKDLF